MELRFMVDDVPKARYYINNIVMKNTAKVPDFSKCKSELDYKFKMGESLSSNPFGNVKMSFKIKNKKILYKLNLDWIFPNFSIFSWLVIIGGIIGYIILKLNFGVFVVGFGMFLLWLNYFVRSRTFLLLMLKKGFRKYGYLGVFQKFKGD